jgi:hypothetical protein
VRLRSTAAREFSGIVASALRRFNSNLVAPHKKDSIALRVRLVDEQHSSREALASVSSEAATVSSELQMFQLK